MSDPKAAANDHTSPQARAQLRRAALEYHEFPTPGKVAIQATKQLVNQHDLSLAYSPGVAAPCEEIAKDPNKAFQYTSRGNLVAVITNGTAVLGLGDIGPLAAKPVMEGKGVLFKKFAGIDVFDIEVAENDLDKLVDIIAALEPTFGGINLEDIKAPECFEIEKRLKEELKIPVMHDDQHGTAIVVLAGLLNALKVVRKKIETAKIVISGAGAAGNAIAHLLHKAGAGNITVLDSRGIIDDTRSEPHKQQLATFTNPEGVVGGLREALTGADVLIGVSGPGLADAETISRMGTDAIVFALANPTPEIMPDEAKKGGAKVIATGRSDFPNQINNSLAFPGIFRGALDTGVSKITDDMKLKAARAIAALVPKPTAERIVPDMFDKKVAKAVAAVIK